MTQQTVLVVDDEPHILEFLGDNLRADDFTVHTASSIAQARSRLNAVRPSLVVLDVSLPDATGFDLCREIRSHDPVTARFDVDVPIIMLTARGEDVDRVRGFERGADDYVVKPFHYPELLARIRALLRRSTQIPAHEVLRVAGLDIDVSTREVHVNGQLVELSQKEFMLLSTLARESRRVFKKQRVAGDGLGLSVAGCHAYPRFPCQSITTEDEAGWARSRLRGERMGSRISTGCGRGAECLNIGAP